MSHHPASAATPAPASTTAQVDVSPLWGAIAVLSLVALWMLAPNGLWLLAFIGVIVLVHEAGHLLAARRAGMEPTEFFWGFGPEVVAFQHNGCRYGIKALSLGGYVKLWGMTPTSVLPDGVEESGTYRAASHWGRLSTILAGPAINLVCGVVAFGAARSLSGQGLSEASLGAFDDVWFVLAATAESLWIWVTNLGGYLGSVFGDGSSEAPVRFMSPVAQATVTGDAVASGLAVSLQWFAILSVAIGAVNLLPLPPLDGSHALVAAAEKVAQVLRRDRTLRFNVQRLEPIAYVTVGALVVLSLTALVMDIRDVI